MSLYVFRLFNFYHYLRESYDFVVMTRDIDFSFVEAGFFFFFFFWRENCVIIEIVGLTLS